MIQLLCLRIHIYPTPPLEQDMTQSQFLSRVQQAWIKSFHSPRLVATSRQKIQSALLFTHSWRENNWIHTFPKGISAMWNAINLVPDLNSYRRVHFYNDNRYPTGASKMSRYLPTQSAGSEEYTHWWIRNSSITTALNMTLNYLIVGLHSWSFTNEEYLFVMIIILARNRISC